MDDLDALLAENAERRRADRQAQADAQDAAKAAADPQAAARAAAEREAKRAELADLGVVFHPDDEGTDDGGD